MNEKQGQLYFFHWGRARRKLRQQGVEPKEADATRKRIHFAIGAYTLAYGKLAVKSSKRLTNAELDLFIARCKAIADPADLQAQLDQLNQPRKRALHACSAALDKIGVEADEDARADYLQRIIRKDLEDSDDADLQRLLICCNHNAQHKTNTHHNHRNRKTVPANDSSNDDPF